LTRNSRIAIAKENCKLVTASLGSKAGIIGAASYGKIKYDESK